MDDLFIMHVLYSFTDLCKQRKNLILVQMVGLLGSQVTIQISIIRMLHYNAQSSFAVCKGFDKSHDVMVIELLENCCLLLKLLMVTLHYFFEMQHFHDVLCVGSDPLDLFHDAV